MKQTSTTSLLDILNNTSINNMENFLNDNSFSLSVNEHFSEYLNKNNMKTADILKNCQGYISKSYVYDLINGKKLKPSRDNVLLICLASHMNLKVTRRTLELFNHRNLYPKDKRDAIIAICINNKIYDIASVNDKLFEYGEKTFTNE